MASLPVQLPWDLYVESGQARAPAGQEFLQPRLWFVGEFCSPHSSLVKMVALAGSHSAAPPPLRGASVLPGGIARLPGLL